jgi:hypothetical protein
MKRTWILLAALAVTLASLLVAMFLGSLGFNYHRTIEHDELLRAVMAREPTASRLTEWLVSVKGAPLLAAPATHAEAERVIAQHGGVKTGELRAKAARYPQLRVFRASDMLYFVFFDAGGVMRDFTCVSG